MTASQPKFGCDLATINPDLAKQAHGWDPSTVTSKSHKEVDWICDSGHVWTAAVHARSRGNGCPIHAGRQVLVGYNDLATVDPKLGKQAHGWDPTTVTAGSRSEHNWICEEGHIWNATVRNRSKGHGCPIHAGLQVLVGYNDLATTMPDLAKQAHGWDPTTVTAGSGKEFDWVCEFGHVWSKKICKRSEGSNCPTCSGHRVLAGFNDLAFKRPDIAKQVNGWDAATVTSSSKRIREWRCDFGHVWKATVRDRTRGSDCPLCAEYGFNPSKPAWLYLIVDFKRDMLKIGVTNTTKQRLRKHANAGFEVIEIVGPFELGDDAFKWEQLILKHLRNHGAIIAKDAGAEKFDGYTESWFRDSFPIASLKDLQSLVLAEDETPVTARQLGLTRGDN